MDRRWWVRVEISENIILRFWKRNNASPHTHTSLRAYDTDAISVNGAMYYVEMDDIQGRCVHCPSDSSLVLECVHVLWHDNATPWTMKLDCHSVPVFNAG